MPGRLQLLSLVRPGPSSSSSSSTKKDHSKHQLPTSLLPPEYSFHIPQRKRSPEGRSMEAFKRHSLGGRHLSDKKSPKAEPHTGAKVDMVVESPPLVFYNSPQTSTGALFSGQLKVTVTDAQVTFDKFEMRLLATVHNKKPVAPHCTDCATQTTEIHKWDLLTAPTLLRQGDHYFPFSHLLPGHLPVTTHGHLATLDYHLDALAVTAHGDKIKFARNLDIKRAIMPGNDKHSIRIFPPTNLTATVTLPPVIHPIGDFPIELRLSGIVTNKDQAQMRWRLRKLNWRIEETQKAVSPACAKHTQKLGGENKGIFHEDTRVIGSEEVKHGWKTDFTQGNIDVEFHAATNVALKPICDMECPSGMNVKHTLVIEMVVAEEWAPIKKLTQATPTGAARVLRTQFHLILTERAGLGISWDEEQPPVYEDVPASPPTYLQVEDYDISQLEDDASNLRL